MSTHSSGRVSSLMFSRFTSSGNDELRPRPLGAVSSCFLAPAAASTPPLLPCFRPTAMRLLSAPQLPGARRCIRPPPPTPCLPLLLLRFSPPPPPPPPLAAAAAPPSPFATPPPLSDLLPLRSGPRLVRWCRCGRPRTSPISSSLHVEFRETEEEDGWSRRKGG